MNGYESYASSFPPEPEYTREVVYPTFKQPLNAWLRAHGVLVETQRRLGAKILSASDGAKVYQTEDGGVAEVMPDACTEVYVVVFIPPDQMVAYQQYHPPLPFWAWSMG